MHYDSGGGGESGGNTPKTPGVRFANRAGTSSSQNRSDSAQSLNSNPHMHQHHQVNYIFCVMIFQILSILNLFLKFSVLG